jgi:hypothetical protein
MDEDVIKHPGAVSSWLALRVTREGVRNVLVVETDLALDPQEEEYEAGALESLLAAVRAYLAANSGVESAEINPIMEEVDD